MVVREVEVWLMGGCLFQGTGVTTQMQTNANANNDSTRVHAATARRIVHARGKFKSRDIPPKMIPYGYGSILVFSTKQRIYRLGLGVPFSSLSFE